MPFSFEQQRSAFEGFKGKYIRFYTGGSLLYGRLVEVTRDGLLEVANMPSTRLKESGLVSCIEEKPAFFPVENVGSISFSSQEEIEAVRKTLIPAEIYLGKPVVTKNGDARHYGILDRLLPNDLIHLKPFLVPRLELHGYRLVWKKDEPLILRNQLIIPVTNEDIERVIYSSSLEYETTKKEEELKLKELALRELQIKRALEKAKKQPQ